MRKTISRLFLVSLSVVAAVLVAFAPIAIVSASHNNDCENSGDAGNYFVNHCEEKCVCEEIDPGQWAHVCYREREEFTCMPSARRERFLEAYKAVTTPGHPQYHQMKNLIEMHGGSNFGPIHTSEWFLPWHRWYAYAVEDILRNEDCRITLPWWRWSKKSTTWWTGPPFLDSDSWLGTDSEGSCVDDGPFAFPGWVPSSGINPPGTCLVRDFQIGSPMPLLTIISNVLNYSPTNYNSFSNALEGLVND
jgi:hypothetical protein